MSADNRPVEASAVQESEMERSLDPDAMSEVKVTIEDALRQASEELQNTTRSTSQANTPMDGTETEQEDDFIIVGRSSNDHPKHAAQDTEAQSETLHDPEHAPQYSESNLPPLRDPENVPHLLETNPPALRDNPENVPCDLETGSPALRDSPENVPCDLETGSQALHGEQEYEPHSSETKLPTLPADFERIPQDTDTQHPTMSDYLEHVPQDSNNQPKFPSNTPDSNVGCSGFTSKQIFFGGILTGAAVIAIGVIIYKNFKSPNNSTDV